MREHSEKEIEIIVRAFKVYLKKIVKHSAFDFAKKVKSSGFTEVVYSDLVDEKVSLSMYDEDTFFNIEKIKYQELEKAVSDPRISKAIKRLKLEEKLLLYLTAKNFSAEQISEKMNLKEQTVWNKRNLIKNKIKKQMEDLNNENRDE